MIVSSPMNEQELRNLMFTASLPRQEQAFSIRYPRGQGVMPNWKKPMEKVEIGTGRMIRDGEELAILTIGHIGNYAVEVCSELSEQGIEVAHFDMRFVKPIDERMLHDIFNKYNKIITVEDGCIQGGFGSAVLESMADHRYQAHVRRLGIPDRIVEHGEQIDLHNECHFGPDGIKKAIIEMLEPVSRFT